jgi:hypothetical protein
MLNHSLILVNCVITHKSQHFSFSHTNLQIHNSLKAGDKYECSSSTFFAQFSVLTMYKYITTCHCIQRAPHLKHSSELDLVPSGENGTKRNL